MMHQLFLTGYEALQLQPLFFGSEKCSPGHDYSGFRDHYILHLIYKGEGTFHLKGKRWELGPRDGFLIPPGEKNKYIASNNNPWHYVWVAWEDPAGEMQKSFSFTPNKPCIHIPNSFIMDLISILQSNKPNLDKQNRSTIWFSSLMLHLQEKYPGKHITNSEKYKEEGKAIYGKKMQEFIHKNYTSRINAADVTRHINLERSYASRIFKNTFNTGIYELFGLDQASIRFGLEYGVVDWLSLGFGRSSYKKTYDGFLKFRILRQSSGARKMPLTLSYYVSTAVTSLKWEDLGVSERTNYNSSRFSYAHQLFIARKFNSNLSLQLMPSLIHKNLVPTAEDKNDIFSIGIGGRYKITNRMSINAEYYYTPPEQMSYEFDQPLSLGLDLETGGHVFQLHFSNAAAFFESGYITETQGSWGKGDIYFGFNISRVFTIVKPKTPEE